MRALRKKKGLTQRQLAELAGTSQQQVQRIEGGVQNAGLDLAVRICAALEARMQAVFPSTDAALKRSGNRRLETAADGLLNPKSGKQCTLKYRLRGGAEGLLPISSPDCARLLRHMQGEDSNGFVVFDAGGRRYAVNSKHLTFCQFRFEPAAGLEAEEITESDVQFYLSNMAEPLRFEVGALKEDGSWTVVQLQHLFDDAETGSRERFGFKDIDGVVTFFRPDDVAMFSVTLRDVGQR